MKNTLIISGHPDLSQSIANKTILAELEQKLPNTEIRKLDSLYPDYQIDINAEQSALVKAEVIVWQFPFHWYSMPALMKKWLDKVFLFGFSHGDGGNKLHGKKLLISFTTGTPKAIYAKAGFMQHDMEDYFAAFESTAVMCGLELLPPVYLNGVSFAGRNEEIIGKQKTEAKAYAEKLTEIIKNL